VTDDAEASNGSAEPDGRRDGATHHRTRRGRSADLSGAPAWMTGELPRVAGEVAPDRSRSGSGRRAVAAKRTAPSVAPNIVRHVDGPASGDAPDEPPATGTDGQDESATPRVPAWHDDLDEEREAARAANPGGHPDQMPRRRRRWALIATAVVTVLALAAGGYLVADRLGLLNSDKDYAGTTGAADVLVTIPNDSTLTDFGDILTAAGVVGSPLAFVHAADGQPLSGGVYKMRTRISAATAVSMMSDSTHRVGRLLVPEGVQLEAKRGVDGKTIPGVFALIAEATEVTVNGRKVGVSVEDLETAAKTASASELGVPPWARDAVGKLPGDYRRIEGLVAPGTWEAIDPEATAVQILNTLIKDSARRYESWGLLTGNRSGLTPYEVLVAASVAEREVRDVDDLPKVARVILNRLAKNQRLEMDSTTNYTAAETNIDVHGDNYKADTRWNTYRVSGLPPTPIATVGEKALNAMLDPPKGDWLYFITVDQQGTTKFSATFEEHLRNRKIACDNKFLTTGC